MNEPNPPHTSIDLEVPRQGILGRLALNLADAVATPLETIQALAERIEKKMLSTGRYMQASGESNTNIHSSEVSARQILIQTGHILYLLKQFRLIANRGPLRIQPVDLRHCLRETAELIYGDLSERNVSLIIDSEKNIPHATGDPGRIQELLVNLLQFSLDRQKPDGNSETLVILFQISHAEPWIRLTQTLAHDRDPEELTRHDCLRIAGELADLLRARLKTEHISERELRISVLFPSDSPKNGRSPHLR